MRVNCSSGPGGCARWMLVVVKRSDLVPGWQLLPHRWIVERTFAWLGRYRRLSKDYEGRTDVSETMIRMAMMHIMVRRLAPTPGVRPERTRRRNTPAGATASHPPAVLAAAKGGT